MSEFNIEALISLLRQDSSDKEQIISAMNKLQFKSIPCPLTPNKCKTQETAHTIETEYPKEPQKPDENLKSLIIQSKENSEVLDEAERSGCWEVLRERHERNVNAPVVHSKTAYSARGSVEDFWERMATYESRKRSNRKKHEKLVRAQDENACSFHPKINAMKMKSSLENAGDRLYKQAGKKNSKAIALDSLKREIEFTTHCTFHPFTNPTAANSRYLESARNFSSLSNWEAVACNAKEEAECTFKPKVNSGRKGLEEYLSVRAHKRLSENVSRASKADKELDGNLFRKQVGNLQEKLKKFLNRQYAFEVRKQDRILKEVENKSKLKATRKSQISAYEMKKLNTKTTNNKAEESKAASKNEINLQNYLNQAQKEYTFHPKILNATRKNRSLNGTSTACYSISNTEKAKRDSYNKEFSECTFRPSLNHDAYLGVKARLNARENAGLYVKQLKSEKLKKEAQRLACRRASCSKEMKHCTHRPQLANTMKTKQKQKKNRAIQQNVGIK
eukprot:TRINITY_DN12728_c0_g3_i10.p1 TRINITY_DN12728_c0_g3~~TRINITY_DN12728_c0_g3_i10.p1  ORF type:complete len:505 (-),score=94.26 TRINITY_DN12728_c0_g3_i10:157-1671(-)